MATFGSSEREGRGGRGYRRLVFVAYLVLPEQRGAGPREMFFERQGL
jgi:hypothetical protein